MKKQNFTVTKAPKGQKGWNLRVNGNQIRQFDRQGDAAELGRNLAKAHQGELTIQGRDGQWRSKDSYGHDPRSIRDTEH